MVSLYNDIFLPSGNLTLQKYFLISQRKYSSIETPNSKQFLTANSANLTHHALLA
jgi:hypothetical protein